MMKRLSVSKMRMIAFEKRFICHGLHCFYLNNVFNAIKRKLKIIHPVLLSDDLCTRLCLLSNN